MISNRIFSLTALVIMSIGVFAQRGTGDSLKSGDVFIIKEYEPRISDAFKLSDNPKISDTTINIDKDLPYEVRTTRARTSFSPEPIKPAKMKGEPLNKMYRAYGLIGIGNNLSTRAELVYNSTRSRKWDYGIAAWHHGSSGNVKDRGPAGFSDNNFKVYGKKFLYNKIVSGELKYDLNSIHKYGYDPDQNTIGGIVSDTLTKGNTAQNYQNIEPRLRYKTYFKDSNKFNYDIAFNYYHYWDKQKSTEDNIFLSGTVDRYFNSEFASVEAMLDVNNYSNSITGASVKSNSTLFGLKPSVITGKDKWKLKIGAGIVYATGGAKQDIYFYPDLYFKYDLVKDIIIPYVGIDGGLERNNYKALTRLNPFLISNPTTTNENTKFNVYGGFRGEVASNLSFNAGASYRVVENLALFYNQTDSVGGSAIYNEFDVLYDDASITNLFIELGFQKTKKFSFLLKGEYFIYEMGNQNAAWNMPELKISFNGRYKIGDKIQLTADIFYIGEREAYSLIAEGNRDYGDAVFGKKLDGLVDLNLGVEYFFSPRWTAFIRMYNIANSNYAVYNEYYQQGITVMGGTTYKFLADKKKVK
ncbi:MAG: hypothetical protein ACPGEG_09145 [Salibacteraceae bacterium]